MTTTTRSRRGTSPLARLQHLNQLLLGMREAGRILTQERDPTQLCLEICRSLAKTRGYATVWIGRMDQRSGHVVPVAVAGAEAGAFPRAPITWDDTPNGHGPVGTAIRERRPVVFDDLAADPRFAPWRADVISMGAASIASFPLLFREKLFGTLTVKHNRVHAFDNEEVGLLAELSTDIAHAWSGIEEALAHTHTRENLETLVEAIPDLVFFKDGDGRWQIINSAAKRVFQTERRGWLDRTDLEMAGDLPELKAAHESCHLSDELAWAARRLSVAEEQPTGPDGAPITFQVHKVPLFHADGRRKGLVVIGRDVSEQKRAERDLREANARLAELNVQLEARVAERTRQLTDTNLRLERYAREIEDLYNKAPCGYHTLDKDGIILRMNDTELSWLGYAREEVVGHRMTEFLSPREKEVFKATFVGFNQCGPRLNADAELLRKDGTVLPTVINSVAVLDADGNFVQSRTTVFDNTDRLKTDQQLRKALEAAAAASRAKSEFLANMSHEIRTPMNAIIGYAQLLQRDSNLPENIRSQIQIINRNSQALLSLLNNILELSKIEYGQLAVRTSVFSPLDLFNDLVSLFQERAMTKHLTLASFQSADLPPCIEADEDKIRRAVANLLSNAIKFTRQGGVQLNVSTLRSALDQLLLVVEVKDTGPGITALELKRLFNRFEQASSGHNSDAGTGLGLYISREYARLMGGDLTVQSEPGAGSVFRLEVPVKASVLSAVALGGEEIPVLRRTPETPGYRVLIVDDLADNREVLGQMLQTVGFEVQSAANGWEALRLAFAWQPQLILMDARMPEMDGFETIRCLRARRTGPQPSIIMVSAAAFEEDRRAALAVGADDFVAKPFRDVELLEKIRSQLGCQYSGRLEAPGQEGELKAAVNLSPESLSHLPAELRQALRAALVVGDFDSVLPLLEQAKELDAGVALALAALASQYDAREMLRLLPA